MFTSDGFNLLKLLGIDDVWGYPSKCYDVCLTSLSDIIIKISFCPALRKKKGNSGI